jgi:predicted RNase H-like nuclease (RuvC/YqgF family)
MQQSGHDIHILTKHFQKLNRLISDLKTRFDYIKNQNAELKSENQRLVKINKIQKNSIDKLEAKLKSKNIAVLISQKDNTSAKHTLNKLIEEVDKCILILNKNCKNES